MGDLTKNLSRKEFACKCGCGFDTIDFMTVTLIQDSVGYFTKKYNSKIKVKITGPNRCKKHNEKIQKKYNPSYIPFSSKSRHISSLRKWHAACPSSCGTHPLSHLSSPMRISHVDRRQVHVARYSCWTSRKCTRSYTSHIGGKAGGSTHCEWKNAGQRRSSSDQQNA